MNLRLPRVNRFTHLLREAMLQVPALMAGLLLLSGCQLTKQQWTFPEQLSVKSERACLPQQFQPSCFYKQDPTGKQNKLIVFVHGIFGSSTSTWGNPANELFWPAMVAADGRFVDYDIYLVNYQAPYVENAPNLYETAGIVLSQLKDHEVFNRYSDLHIIGHSMGGLVLKSMLLRIASGPDVSMLRQVKSVIYLATPSQGASHAGVGSWFSLNPQLKDMERAHLNAFIQSLEDGWVELMLRRDEKRARFPRIHCAYETQETYGTLVVPREMAYTRCDAPLYPMPFNHSGMATPTQRNTDPYLWVMKRILEADTENERRRNAARMLEKAERLRSSHDMQLARAAYTEASRLFQEVEDRHSEAQALRGLGDLERVQGNYDQARAIYTQASLLFREQEDRRGAAQVLRGIAELERMLVRIDQARKTFTEARRLFKEVEDRHGEVQVLIGLGDLERVQGHEPQAREALIEARKISEQLKDLQGEAFSIVALGKLEYQVGHDDLARAAIMDAYKRFENLGYRFGMAQCLIALGELELVLINYNQARAAYMEAHRIFQEIAHHPGIASALLGLGELERVLGHNDEARGAYMEARKIFKEREDRLGEANALVGLGRIESTLKHADLARQHLFQAAGLFEAMEINDLKESVLTEARNLPR
jgi:tetratricopeptide (TPR) repeat protein